MRKGVILTRTPPNLTVRLRCARAYYPCCRRALLWASDSLPPSPAQAAARDLPGRRERKVGRGKRSSVHHGTVWKNPGEASQRAGKGQRPGKLGTGQRRWEQPAAFSGWPLFPGPSTPPRGRGKSLGLGCEEERALAARCPTRVCRAWLGAPRPRSQALEAPRRRAPRQHSLPCARWYGPPGTFLLRKPRPRAGLQTTRRTCPRPEGCVCSTGSEPPKGPGTCQAGPFLARLCVQGSPTCVYSRSSVVLSGPAHKDATENSSAPTPNP